jgi:hypothetical protein
MLRTSLRGAKVLAGSRGARTSSTGLLNAQCSALDLLALEAFLGSLGLLGGDHLDKSETTGFLGVRVAHDLALLDIAILLKHLGDLGLGELGVDAGNEEVRARVYSTIIIVSGSGNILHVAARRKKILLSAGVDVLVERSVGTDLSPWPPGDAERRRLPSLSSRGRGEALRLSRS